MIGDVEKEDVQICVAVRSCCCEDIRKHLKKDFGRVECVSGNNCSVDNFSHA